MDPELDPLQGEKLPDLRRLLGGALAGQGNMGSWRRLWLPWKEVIRSRKQQAVLPSCSLTKSGMNYSASDF